VTGAVERIADVEVDLADTMTNDGKCHPAGRLWAGTKDANRIALGSLYRLKAST
jgi:sugar lactone lactonase YvrE